MQKAGSFDCRCSQSISQWRRRLSAGVMAHGGHSEHILWRFMVQCVAENF